MGANKLVLAAAWVSMLLWAATPVLAGHGHGGGNAFGFGVTAKHVGGHHSGTAGKPHSNKLMGRIWGPRSRERCRWRTWAAGASQRYHTPVGQ